MAKDMIASFNHEVKALLEKFGEEGLVVEDIEARWTDISAVLGRKKFRLEGCSFSILAVIEEE